MIASIIALHIEKRKRYVEIVDFAAEKTHLLKQVGFG